MKKLKVAMAEGSSELVVNNFLCVHFSIQATTTGNMYIFCGKIKKMEEDVRIKLMRSIENDDLDNMMSCIEYGCDLNFFDNKGQTPLMLAVEKGFTDLIIELLLHDVDENQQNEDGWTALIIGSKEGFLDIVAVLLEHGAKYQITDVAGWSALVWASYKGHHEVVAELIRYGANHNERGQHNMTPLIWAAGRGHTGTVKELILAGAQSDIADKYGTSALTWACRKGHYDVIKLLLSFHANVNAVGTHGWTPLIMAAKGGYLDVVELLIEENININAVDQDGWTALSWSAKEGHEEIVLRLLNKGAFLNIPDKSGNTPLILAAEEGHSGVVQALIDTYADLEMENMEGKTALFVAIDENKHNVLFELLSAGAKTEITNKDGDSALLSAVRENKIKCVQMLLEKEADINLADQAGDTVMHIALRQQYRDMCTVLLADQKNAKLLNRSNISGETAYTLDAKNKPPILPSVFKKDQLGENDFDKMDPSSQQELLITTIADFLVEPSLSIPMTLGIYSRWGSGKSTYTQRLMELLEDFRDQEPILAFGITMRLVISCILFGVSIGLFSWMTTTWGDGIATAVCVVVLLLSLFSLARIALVSTNEKIHNVGVSLTKLFTRGLWFLQLVYCIPSSTEEIKPMLPVHVINVDLSHSIMINDNPLISIVNFIRELNDAIESDIGMFIPRLYRLFQAGPYRVRPGTSLQFETRWKTSCCCIPSFLITSFVIACLWVSLIFFGIYGITGPNSIMAVQIACCCILGGAFLVYLLRLCVMVYCFVLPMKKRVKLISTQAGIEEETFLSVIKQELDLCIDMLECLDGFAERQTRVIINLDLIDSLEQQKVLNLVHSINLLLTEPGHPFILIFSVDPRLLIKAVEQSLSTLPGPVVTPYEYLKNIIDLPFYVYEHPKLKIEGILPESLHQLIDEHTFSDTEEIDGDDLEWDRNGDLLSSVTNDTLEGNGHIPNGNGTLNTLNVSERLLKLSPNISSYKKSVQTINEFNNQQSHDQDENIADDISHLIRNNENGTLNDVKRIMNVVSLKGRILRNSEVSFQWNRIAIWVSLCDGWPYKSSWITLLALDRSLNVPGRMSIRRLYNLFGYVMPSLGETDVSSSDGNTNYFDTFIASHKPILTVNDVRLFSSVMFYIDPTIKKLMIDYSHATKSESSSKPPSLAQTLSRQNYTISPSSSKYLWRNPPPDDQFLIQLSVEDVGNHVFKIDGIEESHLPVYKNRLQENNINGRVLATCDLNELREAMQMTFGDWQLFKAWIIASRCPTDPSLNQSRSMDKASTYRSSSRNNSYLDGYQTESMPESPKTSFNGSMNTQKLSARLPALNEKSNTIENTSYPIESISYPIESISYPIESIPYPIEDPPYNIEPTPYATHSPTNSPTQCRKKYRKSISKLDSASQDSESAIQKGESAGGDSSRWHRSADSGFASADVDPNNKLLIQQNQLLQQNQMLQQKAQPPENRVNNNNSNSKRPCSRNKSKEKLTIVEHLNLSSTSNQFTIDIENIDQINKSGFSRQDTWSNKPDIGYNSNTCNTSDALSSASSHDDYMPPSKLPNGVIPSGNESRKKWTFAKFSDGEESQCDTLDIEQISRVVDPQKTPNNINDISHMNNINDISHMNNINGTSHMNNINGTSHMNNINGTSHMNNISDISLMNNISDTSHKSLNNINSKKMNNNEYSKLRPISLSDVPLPPPGMLDVTATWPMVPPAGFDDDEHSESEACLPSPPPSGQRNIAFQASKLRGLSNYKSSIDTSVEKVPLNHNI